MRVFACLLTVALAACGPPARPPPPDAGPDTSCGLDCAAQEHFGLLVNRCFEYSTSSTASNPAAIGVLVRPVEVLEGGLAVLPVEYRESGQVKMTDYFTLKDGNLLLARRSWLPGQSVTYRQEQQGPITGATWLEAGALAGENVSSAVQATVQGSGAQRTEATTVRVVLAAASTSERTVPLKTFDEALQLILSETPDHGIDTRRVFVANTGFIFFATPFSPAAGATASPYYLQKVRDLDSPDGGTLECGFGSP
ncbi:MAG: hypothetical protein ACOZIN_15745 [Myxococcota bacterium]